jgi:hypothetical protein
MQWFHRYNGSTGYMGSGQLDVDPGDAVDSDGGGFVGLDVGPF